LFIPVCQSLEERVQIFPLRGPQLGAIVLPDMVSVPSAGEAFDETGTLVAARPAGRLRTVAERLVEMAEMTSPRT